MRCSTLSRHFMARIGVVLVHRLANVRCGSVVKGRTLCASVSGPHCLPCFSATVYEHGSMGPESGIAF